MAGFLRSKLEGLERRFFPNRAEAREERRVTKTIREYSIGGYNMIVDMLDAGVLPPKMAANVRRSIGEE